MRTRRTVVDVDATVSTLPIPVYLCNQALTATARPAFLSDYLIRTTLPCFPDQSTLTNSHAYNVRKDSNRKGKTKVARKGMGSILTDREGNINSPPSSEFQDSV